MKTLNLYVTRSCALTLTMSIGLLTFTLIGTRLIEIMKFLQSGGSATVAFKILYYFIPYSLALSIPMGVLVTIMLIFGRMSADNEITAMRACGISILQVISPIIIATFLLTGICLYLNLDLSPKYAGEARSLSRNSLSSGAQPLALLEESTQIELDGMFIWFDSKHNEEYKGEPITRIRNIDIFRTRQPTAKEDPENSLIKISEHIKADSAIVIPDVENQLLVLKMDKVRLTRYDGDKTLRSTMATLSVPLDYGAHANREALLKRPKYMTMAEIYGRMEMLKDLRVKLQRESALKTNNDPQIQEKQITTIKNNLCEMEIELNQRFALGLAPISFLFIGLPLAIRTSRKETSVGLFISTGLSLAYLVSIAILGQFSKYPELYPQIILWLPVLVYQVIGLTLLWRIIRI